MLQWVKIIKGGSWMRPSLRPLCPDGLQLGEVTEWKQCWSTGVVGLRNWEQSCACSQCGHSRGKVCLTLRVASGDGGLAIYVVNLQVELSAHVVCPHSLPEGGTKWGHSSPAGSGSLHSQKGQGTGPLMPGWPCQWGCNLQSIGTISCMSCLNKDDIPCIQPIEIYQVLLWTHGRYWGFNIEHKSLQPTHGGRT